MTYNHVRFIEKAIESVLEQKTNYSWRLIIADDFSTDGTRDILYKYQEKYSDIITLILQEKNWGPVKNGTELLLAADSQYVIFFEGDDYWTSPYKMQKQIDFLESNADYSGCFHSFSVLNEVTGEVKPRKHPILIEKDVFTTTDFLRAWFLQTSTLAFRKHILNHLPDFFRTYTRDVTLVLLTSLHGNLKYIDESMTMYRNHQEGMSKQKADYQKELININKRAEALSQLDTFTNFKYHKYICSNIYGAKWVFEIRHAKNFLSRILITLRYVWRFDFFNKWNVKSNLHMLFPKMFTFYKQVKSIV